MCYNVFLHHLRSEWVSGVLVIPKSVDSVVFNAINSLDASVSENTLTISLNGKSTNVTLPVRTSNIRWVFVGRRYYRTNTRCTISTAISATRGYTRDAQSNFSRTSDSDGKACLKGWFTESETTQIRPYISSISTLMDRSDLTTILSTENIAQWMNEYFLIEGIDVIASSTYYIGLGITSSDTPSYYPPGTTGGISCSASYTKDGGWAISNISYGSTSNYVSYDSSSNSGSMYVVVTFLGAGGSLTITPTSGGGDSDT